jgi:uncharacterized protein (DUF58 family)
VARILAATFAQLLLKQQDAAGVTIAAKGKVVEIPPRTSASHLQVLFDALEQHPPAGMTDLAATADLLAEKLPRRSLVCVFSDFFDDNGNALKRLLALRSRKHDLALFHLVDPAELTFPYDDPTLFLSMEDERRLEVNPREIKASYLEEFERFLEETRARCTAADADYERVRTDEALDRVMVRFLSRRIGGTS